MAGSIPTPRFPDAWRAVARHKKKSFMAFLLMVVIAGAAAILLPKRYHSEGLLLVRLGKENSTLDPTVTMGQDPVVTIPASRENELNSVVEILKSRAIAEKVVDVLGPDFILRNSTPASGTAGRPGRIEDVVGQLRQAWDRSKESVHRLDGTSEPDNRDRAITELMSRYTASSARKSDLIQIECQGSSPQWSQKTVAAIMEVYQSEHIRLNRPPEAVEFFSEQAERARRELAARQGALRDLKTASGIVSPVDQRQCFALRLSRLEEEWLQTQAAAKVSETSVETLRKQLSTLPARQMETVTSGIGNEGTDRMRSQLYDLQIHKEEAAAKYTEAHPALQAVDEQVRASRALASKEEATRTHTATRQNPLYQDTERALLQEQTLLAASQAKEGVLNRQLAAVRSQTKDFNQQELSIARLECDIDVCQATYRKYAVGLEQARIDQAREIRRISNITVAQSATCEPAVLFPRKGTFLAIGVLCGLAAAVALACWAETRDRSFREPEDLDRRLGVAVLGAIPHFTVREPVGAEKVRS